MAEALGDDLGVDAGLQGQGGVGVPRSCGRIMGSIALFTAWRK